MQDIILTVANLFFFIALVPSIISADKPALGTSAINTVVLLVITGVYISLQLWLSAAMLVLTAGGWITLAVQKYRQTKA